MRRQELLSLLLAVSAPLAAQSTELSTEAAYGTVVCYDQARQRLVMAQPSRAIWEWNGTHWGRVGADLPAAAWKAVYDPARQRVLFFCGTTMFAYDGHRCASLGATPALGNVVVDSFRQRLVGLVHEQFMGLHTYEWDGTSWQLATPVVVPRFAIAAAYDEHRHVTVAQMAPLGWPFPPETWEWDGAAWTMRLQGPADYGRLFYDSVRQQVLGNFHGNSGLAWNGSSWTPVPTTQSPSAQGANSSFTADPARGLVWFFENLVTFNNTVWAWDGTNWAPELAAPHPAGGADAFTFDAARGRAVLITTKTAARSEWDGSRWHRLAAGGPSGRYMTAQVFDSARGETLVFGGLLDNPTTSIPLGDTWGWNGTTWRHAASTGPSARHGMAAAFDSGRGRVVLVGGVDGSFSYRNDHWEWDGLGWTLVAASTPIQQTSGVMGYDPLRGRLVLADGLQRTWEYVGAQWTQIPVAASPYSYDGTPLVWDASRQRLQGILIGVDYVSRRFEYDGTQWTPLFQDSGLLSYDTVRGRMLNYRPEALTVTTTTPATAPSHGVPCGGTTTETSLTAFGVPRPGDATFHLDLRAQATQRPALLGFGLTGANLPLGNGCALLLQN
ncbi:MAG: hypothetical protein Q7T30_02175, partial [Planctomycetota bacterium]|nr:hypothetical protein [Planctomycetota bacterium]